MPTARTSAARGTAPRTPALPAGHRLLRGVSTEKDRRARRRLVRELLAAGVPEQEIDQAIDEERLVLLPAELILAGRRRYSVETLINRTGLTAEEVNDFSRANGLAAQPEITARHLDIACALREVLDAGMPPDAVLEISRVAGQALASIARVVVRVVGETYLEAGDSEYDVGSRYAEVARDLLPVFARMLDDQLRLHILTALRQESLGRDERASGEIMQQRDAAVAFADLVGFTRLGSRVHADEVGRVATRLVELTSEVISPGVSMVKTVGDAVMLVSPDVERLLEDVVTLVAKVEEEGEDFPQLRAGVAFGPVVGTGGDWYGHTVNLASRLTSVARPGTVLATTEVRAKTRHRVSWSHAVPRHLRGMRGAVFVTRVRGISH